MMTGVHRLRRTMQDITDRKIAEEKLEKLAYFDPLTGLANRSMFHREVNDVLTRCVRTGSQAALLLLDLDRFKEVNDSLGHVSGDELLAKVAQLISRVLGNSHFLSRLAAMNSQSLCSWHDRAAIELWRPTSSRPCPVDCSRPRRGQHRDQHWRCDDSRPTAAI
jgi:predicted signal transduction protein with EAL and GGDEF domain